MEVVETQLVAGCSVAVNTASHADFDIGLGFSLRQRRVFFDYVGKLVLDVKLVGVGVGALGLAEAVDGSRTNLKVLLRGAGSVLECNSGVGEGGGGFQTLGVSSSSFSFSALSLAIASFLAAGAAAAAFSAWEKVSSRQAKLGVAACLLLVSLSLVLSLLQLGLGDHLPGHFILVEIGGVLWCSHIRSACEVIGVGMMVGRCSVEILKRG